MCRISKNNPGPEKCVGRVANWCQWDGSVANWCQWDGRKKSCCWKNFQKSSIHTSHPSTHLASFNATDWAQKIQSVSCYVHNFARMNFASKTVHLDWYLNLTFKGHPRSKIFSPFESPYMTSYLISIDTFSLSRTVFEIFDFKVFRVWPWPLTFRGHLRSKIFPPFESPYMTSYSNPIDTFSLSRTVFEIFDFKGFRVWSWPLTFRGDPKSKIFPPFESPYMTSYLTPIDTFSLSRTVFEIFDFKVFRVWPWPLTFRGHLRSNICSPFESPYMTSYLTSIDTFSLSRNVFEIFDFKVFRVWPWPLTFGVTLGQKYFYHSKAHIWLSSYSTSTSIDTFSLSRTVPFSRYSTSKFLGFDLDLWPLGVTWGQTYFHHLKAHIWLPI